MKTHDFWYDLPEELIAQTPLEKRDTSRLMVLDKATGEVSHKHFYDIIDYLNPGDCLVMNDSRVLPARLLGHRPTGGAVEVLLLRDLGDKKWECLAKPGRKLQKGIGNALCLHYVYRKSPKCYRVFKPFFCGQRKRLSEKEHSIFWY